MSEMTLLDCPFCGTDDHETSPWPSGDEWVCNCGNPDCAVEVTAETPEAAVAKWNRRAHLAQPAQSVDVDMVREVILQLRAYQRLHEKWPDAFPDMELEGEADKLTAALQEKGNG